MKPRPPRIQPTQVEWQVSPFQSRHWASLIGCLLLLGSLGLAGLIAFPFPQLPSHWLPYLTLDARDDRLYALHRARNAGGRPTDIILLGTSAAREAVPTEATGDLALLNLTSNGQTYLEALWLLEATTNASAPWLVLHVSPRDLIRDPRHAIEQLCTRYLQDPLDFAERHRWVMPELTALNAPSERALARLKVYRLGLKRLMEQGLSNGFAKSFYGVPPPEQQRYRFTDRQAGDLAAQAGHRALIKARFVSPKAAVVAGNLRLLDALLALARERGLKVVLMESPRLSGDEPHLYGAFWAEYLAQLETRIDGKKVQYLDLNPELELQPAHFVDSIHVSPAGRVRWSAALFARLQALQHIADGD